MIDIHINEYTLKSGSKSYGYRFEIAPVDGKRQWQTKRGFKTKTEAKRAGIAAMQQYENTGHVVYPSDISFSDYLDLWLQEDCMVDLKDTTIHNYRKRINNHIKPALGTYRLRTIQREQLQSFILDLYDNGYSRNTLSSVISILSKSMNYAVDHKYLMYSPAVRLKIPKHQTPRVPTRSTRRDCIPTEIITMILERFPETTPSHIPLRLGYECGLRIGEAYALVWEDIDLDNQTITVNRQVQWHVDSTRTRAEKVRTNGTGSCGNGYWYFSSPKYNSVRTVTISDSFTALLRREKSRQEAMCTYYGEHYTTYSAKYPLTFGGPASDSIAPDNPIHAGIGAVPVHFVCIRDNGTYISNRTMQHTSSVIQKGIYPKFSFHALHHTHASLLYEAQLSDKYITERMGHKDDRVTKAVYIHLTEQTREQGRKVVNQLFNPRENNEDPLK